MVAMIAAARQFEQQMKLLSLSAQGRAAAARGRSAPSSSPADPT
jgi:flagellar basal body rod protein FlgF